MGLPAALARRTYVISRTARAAALRLAYVAYTRALACDAQSAPPTKEIRKRLEQLFDEDYRDAEAGYYPRELIARLPWREYMTAAPRLLADLPGRRSRIQRENFRDLRADGYPDYYARNFHFQTEGYLGHTSAALYDLQVEMLFVGAADAMRRRLIPPLVRFAQGRPLRVLDVACGTGHLLRMLGASLPEGTHLCGLDLSPHYIERARKLLPRSLDVSLAHGNAERLPFDDGHFDAVTNVFLLHEIPGEVRARVLAEMARVVRPGGLVLAADSIQLADAPELRAQILDFPARYHEPYYLDYVHDNLAARMGAAGLHVVEERSAFVTKLAIAQRPSAAR